jgi:phosphate transport system permease protein
LWGIFIMIPWLRDHVMVPTSHGFLMRIPILNILFKGDPIGPSMLAAGVILAIMVIPFITAITRDIMRAIPKAQREGSFALGATQWETISKVVIPYAKSGIIGAVILGLGRALGETMAVTMVIGNQATGISWSLFDPGYTMASALANKYNEAGPGLNGSALVEIGLILFVVAVIVNIFARLLVFYTAKNL